MVANEAVPAGPPVYEKKDRISAVCGPAIRSEAPKIISPPGPTEA